MLQALLEDFAAEGDSAAQQQEHNPDFTDPDAVRFHVAAYWRFTRRNWPVLHAMNQAALVNADFAQVAARFSAEHRNEVAEPGRLRRREPAPAQHPDASLAMMFLAIHGLLEVTEDGMLDLSDDDASV